jgi:methylated-DNA-protein-cysteine methyltransferase-like protein
LSLAGPFFSSANRLISLNPTPAILSFSLPRRTVTIAAGREFAANSAARAKFGPCKYRDATQDSNCGNSLDKIRPGNRPRKIEMSLWDPVYKLVKQIPRGRVLSYGAVAKALRLKGGARSAGRAMSATPQGHGIPWHRVLNAAGKIVIREPYAGLQRKLLESEGIEVIENRVKMKNYLWTPSRKRRTSPKHKPSVKRKK